MGINTHNYRCKTTFIELKVQIAQILHWENHKFLKSHFYRLILLTVINIKSVCLLLM